MHAPRPASRFPGLLPILFWGFLIALAVFGGASRQDVSAQIFIRVISSVVLALSLAFGMRFARQYRDVALFMAAVALVIAIQLIPLPPEVWHKLPGHAAFSQADLIVGRAPWRPLSLTPDATLNALFALLPPLALFVLIASDPANQVRRLAFAILLLAGIGSTVEFIQFVGGHFNNPFINDDPLLASGFMANRNHQAVLLVIGIVAAPTALIQSNRNAPFAAAAAAGTGLWFTCLILATGSRAGMALSVLAWIGAITIAAPIVMPAMRRLPRYIVLGVGTGLAAIVSGVVVASIWSRRAVSVERLSTLEIGEDMRTRGLPTVWNILRRYFPTGTGAGSFDPVFRVHEPFALLKPTYFNHAHNDWLEVAIDTGLTGTLLLVAGIIWWLAAAWSAWRNPQATARRTGTLAILLLMLASIVDYPLRTPTMMGVLVLAGCMVVRSRRGNETLPPRLGPV